MIKIKRTKAGTAVTFALDEAAVAGPVSVVGDFNDWTPGTHLLKKRSNGTRSVSVTLPEGSPVAFRYLAEGGVWFDDESAQQRDERGSLISV